MAFKYSVRVLPVASMWTEVLLQRAAREREADLLKVMWSSIVVLQSSFVVAQNVEDKQGG